MTQKKGRTEQPEVPAGVALSIDPGPIEAQFARKTELDAAMAGPASASNPHSAMLDAIADAAIVTDSSFRIVDAGKSAMDILLQDRASLFKLTAGILFLGADKAFLSRLKKTLAGEAVITLKGLVMRKDGTVFYSEGTAGRFSEQGRDGYLFIIRQKAGSQPENGSDPSSKLTSEDATTMVRKVAHDFENLLTPFFSFPDIIRRDLPPSSRAGHLLELMERSARDMRMLAQQLRHPASGTRQQPVILNVNSIVQRIAETMEQSCAVKNIEFKLSLSGDLLPVLGLPEQLLRALQNLCQNAAEAMEQSGTITVETENVYVDRFTKRAGTLPGEYVRVRVSDSGCGIPDDLRERVFEPFFTTKTSGERKGSGLGLSVVRDVVTEHHGWIELKTSIGHGTSFDLNLPICRRDYAPSESRRNLVSGRNVLVVDDDTSQQEVISGLLERAGCRVKCLPSGESAIEYMNECAVQQKDRDKPEEDKTDTFPDLILLDTAMHPGMSGREACNRILEVNPRQQIIMMAAVPQADEGATQHAVGTIAYLRKPLSWHGLDSALHSLHLDHEPAKKIDSETPGTDNLILIVDDEEGICRLFQMILSSAFPQAKIETANNGGEALEAFKQGHHSVIVMDLRMPVMDGRAAFNAINELCTKSRWRMPSVVFCTGFAPPGAIREVVKNNRAHCLLTKPVSGEDLVLAVKKRLSTGQ